VADDGQVRRQIPRAAVRAGQAGGSGEGGDVRGVVDRAVVTLPCAGPAVAGLIDGDDVSIVRRECRPDPPERRRARADAMEQEGRSRIRRTPGDPGEGDPDGGGDAALRRVEIESGGCVGQGSAPQVQALNLAR
jgi:hypothetical protein